MIAGMGRPIQSLGFALLIASGLGLAQPQLNDSDFSAQVEHPAFMKKHPRVGIDEGHRNFHTRDGRYKPFAALMESDGFAMSAGPHFDAASLKSVDILVVANAAGAFLDSATAPRKGPGQGPSLNPR